MSDVIHSLHQQLAEAEEHLRLVRKCRAEYVLGTDVPLQSPLQHPITTFVERETGTKMGRFSKRTCYKDGKVYLDTSQRKHSSYFDGVPEDVWNFHVGGYQVLRKWL